MILVQQRQARASTGPPDPTGPLRAALAGLLAAVAVVRLGWTEPLLPPGALSMAAGALSVAYLGVLAVTAFSMLGKGEDRSAFLSLTRFEQIVAITACALVWWWPAPLAAGAMLLLVHTTRIYLSLVQRAIPPGLVFVGSFMALIAVGTAILHLPSATPEGQPISTVDALFTITSAISQTGLVVRPTGDGFTRFGQIIILVWIQVGALGVIVFGALLASVMGRGFGIKAAQTIADPTETGWAGQLSLIKLVMFIIITTHALELVGAIAFYFSWPESWPGMPADMNSPLDRAYHAVFFAISSFCNAGFVTTSDSMASLRSHWTPHVIICGLILLGSIGFPVLDNIRRVLIAKIRGQRHDADGRLIRLTLNSKLILATALGVYVFGFVFIFLGEVTQAGVAAPLAVLDAHFMNIQRTAGFNTIAPQDMGLLSQLTLVLLMFIGGAPASVAGGIKLVALAVTALTVWATITGQQATTAFGRTIPDVLVRKSATIVIMCLVACMATTGALAITERGEDGAGPTLNELLFESVSAVGTTGLSLGITSELSDAGRLILCVAMFVGRVGVLAIVASLVAAAGRKRVRIEYPREEVVVY
ncbi:MAG: potassium transporter TrkG [Planctomycetota bacterium]